MKEPMKWLTLWIPLQGRLPLFEGLDSLLDNDKKQQDHKIVNNNQDLESNAEETSDHDCQETEPSSSKTLKTYTKQNKETKRKNIR